MPSSLHRIASSMARLDGVVGFRRRHDALGRAKRTPASNTRSGVGARLDEPEFLQVRHSGAMPW